MPKLRMWGSYEPDDDESMCGAGRSAYDNPAQTYAGSDADDDYDDDTTQADASFFEPEASPNGSFDHNNMLQLDGPGTKYATAKAKAEKQRAVDDRMYTLKKEGFSDKEIADKLVEEDLANYQARSIAGRLVRINRKRQEQEDARLDDELSDWHVGEDEMLHNACTEVDAQIEKEIDKLRDKKWKRVSAQLAEKMTTKKYSAKACKERFDGLADSTALIPIELDPDQEGRKILRENRIANSKRLRREAAEGKVLAARTARQEKLQDKMQLIQRKIDKKEITKANKAERAAEKRLREEKQEAKKEEMRERELVKLRIQRKQEEKLRVQELENLVFHYYTGRFLQRRHRPETAAKKGVDEDFVSESDEYDPANLLQQAQDDGGVDDEEAFAWESKKEKKPATDVDAPKVSKQTLLNPRSIMTTGELDTVLAKRGLPRRTPNESHPQVVARIAAADKTLKTQELENFLRAHFAPIKGSLAIRARRLAQCDAKESAAGRKGVTAEDLDFKMSYEGYGGKYVRFIDDE